MAYSTQRGLAGFRLNISFTMFYLSLIVLLPLAACFASAARLSPADFWAAVSTERAQAAYLLTFGASFVAAAIARMFVPLDHTGMLRVRGKVFDVAWMGFLGVSLVVLSFIVPG